MAKDLTVFTGMAFTPVLLQRMIGELAGEFAQPGSTIYDLGCSTGITMETLMKAVPGSDIRFIGLDNSEAMLERARQRLTGQDDARWSLSLADLNQGFPFANASVIVVNLVLQFVRPLYRDTLIHNLFTGLNDGGCVILVEKVLGNDSLFNRTFIKLYYDMKRQNGYSEDQIMSKRRSLENVLSPLTPAWNEDMLRAAGFAI